MLVNYVLTVAKVLNWQKSCFTVVLDCFNFLLLTTSGFPNRLKHPSILELYAFFEDTNYVYLVLELCHKGELYRYMKETGESFAENQGQCLLPLSRSVPKWHWLIHAQELPSPAWTLARVVLRSSSYSTYECVRVSACPPDWFTIPRSSPLFLISLRDFGMKRYSFCVLITLNTKVQQNLL